MTPYYQDDAVTLYLGDCRQVLPTLGHVGLIVTDPPYGTGGWRRLVSGAGSNPSGSLVQEDWDDGLVDWLALAECDAVLTFWPPARTSHLLNAANTLGLTKHRQLYMRKPDPKPLPGGRTRWSVEPIWALSPDGFVLYGNTDDVYEHSTPRRGQPGATGHPYQKPVNVLKWIIAKTGAGYAVCDPFAGSGTTAVAAKMLGRRCVCIEQDESWCEIAARRLQQSVMPLEAMS